MGTISHYIQPNAVLKRCVVLSMQGKTYYAKRLFVQLKLRGYFFEDNFHSILNNALNI